MDKPRMRVGGRSIEWNDEMGEPQINQGTVHGFPVSWNPDTDRFYLHDKDKDEIVLNTFVGTMTGFRNLVQSARMRAAK